MKRPEAVFFMASASANTHTKKLNDFIDYQEQQIKELQSKLNTYEIEQGITMKHVQPVVKPIRTINYEGKDRDKYYLDASTWMALCNDCHSILHLHPKESREKGHLF